MKRTCKKIYAVLLSALLALSLLTACGGGGSSGGEVRESPSAGEVSESPSGGEVRRNSPGDLPEDSEESATRPVIGLTAYTENHYDDDLNMIVNSVETELPGADADTYENYPELAAALESFRLAAYGQAMDDYKAREEMLPEFMESGGDDSDYVLYGETHSVIRRADAQVVSVVNVYSEYAGGTHDNYSYSAANFDVDTGEEIELESLLTDEGAETLNDRIAEKLADLYPDVTPVEGVADYGLEDYTFSLDPDGVTFWFSPGEIAPYAAGLLTVKLFFHSDDDLLDDTYETDESFWYVEICEGVYRFINENADLVTVDVWGMLDKAQELENEKDAYVFDIDVFHAHIRHGDCFVVIPTLEDGDHDTFVYSEDGELVQSLYRTGPATFFYPEVPDDADDIDWDDYGLYEESLTNPQDTHLYTFCYLFGAWEPAGSYRLAADGFELDQELLYGSGLDLTLKQDLTVTRCDPDDWTEETDEEITIPEGRGVKVVAADAELTTAYFLVMDDEGLTDDDEIFIFALSYDDESREVDGVEEDDLFDGLEYIG